jgi:hypothetical protein
MACGRGPDPRAPEPRLLPAPLTAHDVLESRGGLSTPPCAVHHLNAAETSCPRSQVRQHCGMRMVPRGASLTRHRPPRTTQRTRGHRGRGCSVPQPGSPVGFSVCERCSASAARRSEETRRPARSRRRKTRGTDGATGSLGIAAAGTRRDPPGPQRQNQMGYS